MPNVRIEDGVRVDRVHLQGRRVVGVEIGVEVDGELRRADLVVDCSGRSSRIAHELEASGVLAPPVSLVRIDCAYASCLLARGPDDLDGGFMVCGPTPPRSYRIGAVLPVEQDRWMVTLSGVHGEVPPTDDEGFLAFTRTLLSPAVAQLVERCERVSPIAHYRFPASRRRHYEKAARPAARAPRARRRGLQLRPGLRAGDGLRRAAGGGAGRAAAVAASGLRGAAAAVPPAGGHDPRRALVDRRRRGLPAPG